MALFKMELRRTGEVLRTFETENIREARNQALKWHETTMDAVIVLFVDGKEVRLKDTKKALGFKLGEFDSLSRYTIRPLPKEYIKRRATAFGSGRVGTK